LLECLPHALLEGTAYQKEGEYELLTLVLKVFVELLDGLLYCVAWACGVAAAELLLYALVYGVAHFSVAPVA
jgi:hypothetical protein